MAIIDVSVINVANIANSRSIITTYSNGKKETAYRKDTEA